MVVEKQDAADSANSALTASQDALAEAEASLNQAESAAQDGQTTVDEANAALAKAKADKEQLAATLADPNALADAQQQLADLEDGVDEASTKANETAAALATATADLNAKQASADQALAADSQAQTKLTSAQQNLAAATKAEAEAQQVKQQADQQLADAQANVASAKQVLSTAQAELEKAKSTEGSSTQQQEALEAALKTAEQQVSAATKAVEDSKAEAAKQWDKGSLGFFEDNGSTQAVAVFSTEKTTSNNTPYLAATNSADPDDATSLDNMQKVFPMLRKANEYRARGGIDGRQLSVLKVSDYDMAVAQHNANWSAEQLIATSQLQHAFPSDAPYENLAAGTGISGNGPFVGWWDKEKEAFDDLRAKGFDSRTKMDAELFRLYQAKTPHSSGSLSVGHYLNLVDHLMWPAEWSTADRQTMGFAYRPVENMYRNVENIVINPSTVGQSYSVDEYEALFNSYYNDLKDAKTNGSAESRKVLSDAQAALVAAQKALGNVSSPQDKQEVIEAAQKAVEQAEGALAEAEQARDAKQASVRAAQTSVDEATEAKQDSANILTQAESALASARQLSDSATKALDSAKTIQADAKAKADLAAKDLSDAQAKLADAKAKIAAFSDKDKALADAQTVIDQRTAEVDQAKKNLAALQQAIVDGQAEVDMKTKLLAAAQGAADVANVELADAKLVADEALAQLKLAGDDLALKQAAYAQVLAGEQEAKEAAEALTKAQTEKQDAANQVKQADKVLVKKIAKNKIGEAKDSSDQQSPNLPSTGASGLDSGLLITLIAGGVVVGGVMRRRRK